MRIAILSPIYPYRGGIAQFSGMLYSQLMQDGHEVKAFNFKRLYPDLLFPGKTQYVEEGDQAMAVPNERVLDSINPLSYFQTVKAIQAFRPEVLIISYWMSFFVPGYAHIANRLKPHCKVIALVHNAIPHEPRFFDKPLTKLLFRQCHGFLALSDNVAKDVRQLFPNARIVQHPHPLYEHFGTKQDRTAACERLGINPARKTLLFFGLIRAYKGLDLLIEAMGLLPVDYQLVIAGECYGSFEKYQALIEASPAKGRIWVHNGYVHDEAIPIYFSAADALVLPYRSATQSGVVSVAYHFDLPMVSTPVGDFAQSIGLPQTGIVTQAISPASIAEGIQTLFTPAWQALLPTQIAKEKAALSWGSLTSKLLSFIRHLS